MQKDTQADRWRRSNSSLDDAIKIIWRYYVNYFLLAICETLAFSFMKNLNLEKIGKDLERDEKIILYFI